MPLHSECVHIAQDQQTDELIFALAVLLTDSIHSCLTIASSGHLQFEDWPFAAKFRAIFDDWGLQIYDQATFVIADKLYQLRFNERGSTHAMR